MLAAIRPKLQAYFFSNNKKTRSVSFVNCSFQITDVLWRIVFLIIIHSFARKFDLLMNKQLSRVTSRDMKYNNKQTS